ncbi:MAG: class I adenylate-forming enzyme family protein [Pseudomonadota bacterium]
MNPRSVIEGVSQAACWAGPLPAMRREAHLGNRVVHCFSERPHSVYQMFVEAVARSGSKEALVCDGQRLTWDEVHAEVARVAGGLAARGVLAGDRVGLLLHSSNEFVIAFLACARLGAIAVPLSTRSQTPELLYILNHCSAKALFHDDELGPLLPAAEQTPALMVRIVVGSFPDSVSWQALLDPCIDWEARVSEDETAAIVYTSGTTGHPKGAMLSHLNIVHGAMHYQTCMGLGSDERSLVAVPMSHVTGLIALVATALRCASTLIVMRSFKTADFLALASQERMTHTVLVPTIYNLCLLQPDFERYDLSAWRVGGFGGAAMPPATIAALARRAPGLQLMNAYGATETVCAVAITPGTETVAHLDRVGRVVPCAEIVIMDENGIEQPANQQGEIWIKGPMVATGYWENPEATKDNFPGGFWRSGDIGSINDEGFVGIYDRKKDMINRGGYKIFTVEVENVLAAHPAVLEAAVVAKPCPVLGERVHAFVAMVDASVEEDTLRRFCAERMSDYKVPESFSLSAEPLPRNANGKVLKRVLREQAATIAPLTTKSSR